MTAETPEFRRGRLAYEAYLDAVDGNSPVTGDALPEFEDCPEPVRQGWIAAALAVQRDVLQR